LIALATLGTPQTPVRAEALTFGTPTEVASLGKAKGEPIQLAWSSDGTQLYLQMGERTRIGTFQNLKHYVVNLADGKMKDVDGAPQWATDYQAWKSNKWAPGARTFAIDIADSKRTTKVANSPMGGALAKGGESGAAMGGMDEAVTASLNSQTQHVITLKLKGETVGEYVDTQFVPGYTFSWAPQSIGPAIAYENPIGRLSVMDQQGGKKEVPGTKSVMIPAWSESGTQIAFLEREGKKFALYKVDVK